MSDRYCEAFTRACLVHIPKTGGSSLSSLQWLCAAHGHDINVETVPKPAIIVLRDPVARFLSAFDMFRAQRHITESVDEWFADFEANINKDWPGHCFRPQSWYWDGKHRDDVVVLRTEWLDTLFGPDLPPRGDRRRNEARRNWAGVPDGTWERTVLTDEQTAMVRRHYAADYDLLR